MSETDLIERIAVAVADHVRPALPVSIALWDAERIAEYLVRSPRVVRERVVTLPGFPTPIRIPSVQSGKREQARALPRWKAAEVIAWTESYRERRAGRPRKVG
ncbi:hypothetical protein FGG12_21395 [Cupriavidus campinensis]|uniref:AlpA family phage regulatory protein n=2 Tax=Cupriavidus campinensis TaxID=151783 RepID=A0ABY3EIH4_9BURK|nr:hypothetical protein FGG12_21395 [Cupriavidus campinensis]